MMQVASREIKKIDEKHLNLNNSWVRCRILKRHAKWNPNPKRVADWNPISEISPVPKSLFSLGAYWASWANQYNWAYLNEGSNDSGVGFRAEGH